VLNLLHVIPRDERLHELLCCDNCRSVFTALQCVSEVIYEHLLAMAGVFIARGAIIFIVFLALERFRFGWGGCEYETHSPLSWWSTTNRSGNMSHTRGLLATLKIGERNAHYIQQGLRTEIGTVLAIPGLRSAQLAWPILAAQRTTLKRQVPRNSLLGLMRLRRLRRSQAKERQRIKNTKISNK
jgi:hypothetical protein